MREFFGRYLQHYGRYTLCLITTAIYNLTFNWELGFSILLLYAFCYTLIFALVLTRYKWLFAMGLPVLFLPSALAVFYINNYNVKISAGIVSALLETTKSEAIEYISGQLVLWIVFAVVACALLIWANFYLSKRYPVKRDWYFDIYLVMAIFVIFFFCLAPVNQARRIVLAFMLEATLFITFFKGLNIRGLITQKKIKPLVEFVLYSTLVILSINIIRETRHFHPFDFTLAIVWHYEGRAKLLKAVVNQKDISKYKSSFDEDRGKDLNIILILGESARPDHLQINGYERETTPLLAKRKNLITFKHVKSRSALTQITVPNILTRITSTKFENMGKETSFLSLYRKHDFYTAWLSMNHVYVGNFNKTVSLYAERSDFKFFRKEYEMSYERARDDHLLPIYNQVLHQHLKGKLFVVLHTRGSHWRYDHRYPKEFEKFPVKGMCNTPAECHQPSLVNAYDNSILFTDYIIDKIMEAVCDRMALVVYIGDHGQSLGEDNVYGHGGEDRKEQLQVPLIWWGTPKFIENYGEQFAILESRKDDKISQDHFFHTLLDLTGFKTKVINNRLSLVHTGYRD